MKYLISPFLRERRALTPRFNFEIGILAVVAKIE